jgi:hypothetical protein
MRIFSRAPDVAFFHNQIETTKAKRIAGSIYVAILDIKITVIVTGKAIISGPKIAILYHEIITKPGVEGIMPASNLHILDNPLAAMPEVHCPVGRPHDGNISNRDAVAIC